MNTSRYWAYEWLDSHGIDSLPSAKKALRNKRTFEHIHDLAVAAKAAQPSAFDPYSLVAGRAIDLSGHLDCYASSCRLRQVDHLFSKALHYFDEIVVADAMSHEVTMHWGSNSEDLQKWFLSHIEMLLYLRHLGAEPFVVFREKPPPCEMHLGQHATEAGLGCLFESRQSLADDLLREAHIAFGQKSDQSASFAFNHPSFEHTVWDDISLPESISSDDLRRAAAVKVLDRYLAHLNSDVLMSKICNAPLGSSVWLHGELLRKGGQAVLPENVVLEIGFPILRNVPIRELVRIRHSERDAFMQFRDAIKQAINEKLRSAGDTNAQNIADDIRRDLIEPQVHQIERRLRTGLQLLEKKAGVSIGLGYLVTTCGAFVGTTPSVAFSAGIAAIAGPLTTASFKHLEDKRDVGLSDMYFLWKALKHGHN